MKTKELTELDAFIAEHVMGYCWWFDVLSLEAMLCRPDETWPSQKRFGFKICESKPFGCTDVTDLSMFKPSTDPAAAMQVLEKCAKDRIITIEHGATAQNKMQWMVAWLTHEREDCCKCAETLPLAICLFAKQLFSNGSPKR